MYSYTHVWFVLRSFWRHYCLRTEKHPYFCGCWNELSFFVSEDENMLMFPNSLGTMLLLPTKTRDMRWGSLQVCDMG